MPRKIYPEGTIKVNTQGIKFIKVNGKWEYVKKPRDEWKTPLPKPKARVTYNYPSIKIPENMKETKYSGYYITKDGKAYREPGKYDRNEQYGKINEYGLIYLKPGYRGHPKYPEHQYECINISIRDKNGKYLKQIRKSIHQLVAEVFVPNPEGHTEIDHIDRNNKNNHYTNLKWCSRSENLRNKEYETYKITDTLSGKVWEGLNLMDWARDNEHLVKSRMKTKNQGWKYIGNHLCTARAKGHKIWKFKVEY
jgi:hypothetical protein